MLIRFVTLCVCMYVYQYQKATKKNYKVTHKSAIFSLVFPHRWLRISETTDHAKILDSQDYVFKVPVILGFCRQKHQLQVAV